MRINEGFGFLLLIACLVGTALSLTLLPKGVWQVLGLIGSVGFGVLSGGLYAWSAGKQKDDSNLTG